MSHLVADNRAGEEGFAALLERLTRLSDTEEADVEDKTASVKSFSEKTVGARKKLLVPTTKVEDRRGASADGAELSYEQALRMHSRKRRIEDAEFEPPVRDVDNSMARCGVEPAKQGEVARIREQTKPAVAAQITAPAPILKHRPGKVVPRCSKTAVAGLVSNQKKMKTPVSMAGLQKHELQLVSRRSVVSVRLNEAELETLRDRATESGISISAYMRACVLDADLLRAQVKQTLTEMRAASGSSPMTRNTASALPSAADDWKAGKGAWTGWILRSAALIFGSLLPFRGRG